ncbi:hypothetical protein WDU94_003368 [Cyamophila willieti]
MLFGMCRKSLKGTETMKGERCKDCDCERQDIEKAINDRLNKDKVPWEEAQKWKEFMRKKKTWRPLRSDKMNEDYWELMKRYRKQKTLNGSAYFPKKLLIDNPEDRHKDNEKRMRYYLNHFKHSQIMKEVWKKRKELGITLESVNRRKRISETMKQYWERFKEEGNTNRDRKISKKLKAYWKKLKDEGRTDRQKQFIQHSKHMKEFWMRQRLGIRTIKSLKERMKDYWNKEYNEDWQKSLRKFEKEKTVMGDPALMKVDGKNCLLRMRRETKRSEANITKTKGCLLGKWTKEQRKHHSKVMKMYWDNQKRMKYNARLIQRNKKVSLKLRAYWKKLKDEGRTRESIERFRKIAITMKERWRKFKAGIREGKSLKERMDEYWKKHDEEEKRKAIETDKLLEAYWEFHEKRNITPRTARPTTTTEDDSTYTEPRYNNYS